MSKRRKRNTYRRFMDTLSTASNYTQAISRPIPPHPSRTQPSPQELQHRLEDHVEELRAMYRAEGAEPLGIQYGGPLKIGFWVRTKTGQFWVAVHGDLESITKAEDAWIRSTSIVSSLPISPDPFVRLGERAAARSRRAWTSPNLDTLSKEDISYLAHQIALDLNDNVDI